MVGIEFLGQNKSIPPNTLTIKRIPALSTGQATSTFSPTERLTESLQGRNKKSLCPQTVTSTSLSNSRRSQGK